MSTFAKLKSAVLGYANREEQTFIRAGFNCLDNAINSAKQWAQRTHIFTRASVEVTIPSVGLTSGADLSTAVLRGTTTAVQIRALLYAWLPISGGGTVPITIVSRDEWVKGQLRRFDRLRNNKVGQESWSNEDGDYLELVFDGKRVHFSNASTDSLSGASSTDVHFDATQWLDDYEDDSDTDFLLQYAFDFMLLRSIFQLNYFLKEDARIPLNIEAMNDAWLSVIRWDTSIIPSSVTPNMT